MAETASTSASKPVPEGYRVLQEGSAAILQKEGSNEVFFNPAQVFNRDMSVAVLRWFVRQRQREAEEGVGKRLRARQQHTVAPPSQQTPVGEGIRVLEALAASGLRSIRYAKEVEGIARVDANDLDAGAVASMRQHIAHNDVEHIVAPQQGDARVVMLQNASVYDAVDLDPYGSPCQLLDGAVQAVNEGGLLMITATDMAVLCGNNGEACWAKYGSYPLHKPYCHEMALRILLHSIQQHAGRYKRHIVPILSLSIDFYIRVFVRVYTSPAAVKESANKLCYVFQSIGCDSFYIQTVGGKAVREKQIKFTPGVGPVVPQQCPDTGSGFYMGGPFWAAAIHDARAVEEIAAGVELNKERHPAYKKLHAILTVVREELEDVPLYYVLHDICKSLKCTPPKMDTFRSAIVNAGYRVSSTHCKDIGVKTDAPPNVIWDIMRCWIKEHPVKPPKEGSNAAKLLAKEPTLTADFSRAPAALSKSRLQGVPRYLPNPEQFWGPKPRHGRPLLTQPLPRDGAEASDAAENGDAAAAAEPSAAAVAGEGVAAADGGDGTVQAASLTAEDAAMDNEAHVTATASEPAVEPHHVKKQRTA